mgnify:CR=1 FL=1
MNKFQNNKKMKNIFITLSILFFNLNSFSQTNCNEAKEETYKKVMSSAFAKDFEKCPVIINCEYFTEGYLNGWRKPNKLKKMYFFQCVDLGEKGKPAPLSNEMSGDFFVIDKEKADEVLKLKKGDKIRLTGKTFTQNFYGTEINTFFIVEKVEKLTK